MYYRIQRLLKVKPDEARVEPMLNQGLYGMTPELTAFFAGAFQIDYMGSSQFESINRRYKNFRQCMQDIFMSEKTSSSLHKFTVSRPDGFDYERDRTGGLCYDPNAQELNADFAIIAPPEKMEEAVEILKSLTDNNYKKGTVETYDPTYIQEAVFKGGFGCDEGEVGAWFAMDIPAMFFYDKSMFLSFHDRLREPSKYMKSQPA